MALNISMEGTIDEQILRHQKFPRNLFVGSEERVRGLRYSIGSM